MPTCSYEPQTERVRKRETGSFCDFEQVNGEMEHNPRLGVPEFRRRNSGLNNTPRRSGNFEARRTKAVLDFSEVLEENRQDVSDCAPSNSRSKHSKKITVDDFSLLIVSNNELGRIGRPSNETHVVNSVRNSPRTSGCQDSYRNLLNLEKKWLGRGRIQGPVRNTWQRGGMQFIAIGLLSCAHGSYRLSVPWEMLWGKRLFTMGLRVRFLLWNHRRSAIDSDNSRDCSGWRRRLIAHVPCRFIRPSGCSWISRWTVCSLSIAFRKNGTNGIVTGSDRIHLEKKHSTHVILG